MKFRWVVLSIFLLALGVSTAVGDTPGNSNAFGKSLDEWMKLYVTWDFGGDQEDREGDVVFLPGIMDAPYSDDMWSYDEDTSTWTFTTEMDVTLKVGEKFVAPCFYYYGEEYEDGSMDDPEDEYWLGVLHDAEFQVVLDGKVIVDSESEDIEDQWFGPVYFDDELAYDEPNAAGGIGVAFIEGYGYVHEPLSKGEHTLAWRIYLEEFDPDWDEEYAIVNVLTTHITVTK